MALIVLPSYLTLHVLFYGGAQRGEKKQLMDKRRAGSDGGRNVDMIEVPAQLTGDHLNGWRAGEVLVLKSSEESH